jgi:hypothetical protein
MSQSAPIGSKLQSRFPHIRCSSDIGEGRTVNVMSAYTCEYSEWRVMG